MTRLIKSHDAAASAVIRTLPAAERQARDAERQARRLADVRGGLAAEIVDLKREVEKRDLRISRFDEDLDQAFSEGLAEGRLAGLREAEDREADRLAALASGIETAILRYAEAISATERLSAAIAREALAKVLGPDTTQAELMPAVIQRQIELLERQALIGIEVSRQDFAKTDQVAALAAAINQPQVALQTTDDLPAGGCRIRLRLGVLEVGVDQQWRRLRDILGAIAAGDAV